MKWIILLILLAFVSGASGGDGVVTIPSGTWFSTFLIGSDIMTVTEIKASMSASGLDPWGIYRWVGTGYATTGEVKPCEGIVVYCNNTGGWSI